MRVLLVEDDPLIGLDLAQQLQDAGIAIIGPARRAQDALVLLRERECDAAVVDVNLGAETAEAVALELRRRAIPFVITSGYASHQQAPAFLDTPHLAKPIRVETLLELLRRLTALR